VGDLNKYRSFDTSNWKLVASIELESLGDGLAVFSPDSRMLAINWAPGIVRLVDPLYSKVYATLPAGTPLCFSRDGSLLITQNETIEVWDLKSIRRQLALMGLDWDLPSLTN